ncbi:hypothetical protein MFUR16E_17515 [Methylobacterium fujisawaense]
MLNETSAIFAALLTQMPEDVPLNDPEPEPQDDGAPETGSAPTACEKRDAAQRKRAEGIPEPRLRWAAIATALCDLSRRGGLRVRVREQTSFGGISYDLGGLLGQAMVELVERRGVAQPQARRSSAAPRADPSGLRGRAVRRLGRPVSNRCHI